MDDIDDTLEDRIPEEFRQFHSAATDDSHAAARQGRTSRHYRERYGNDGARLDRHGMDHHKHQDGEVATKRMRHALDAAQSPQSAHGAQHSTRVSHDVGLTLGTAGETQHAAIPSFLRSPAQQHESRPAATAQRDVPANGATHTAHEATHSARGTHAARDSRDVHDKHDTRDSHVARDSRDAHDKYDMRDAQRGSRDEFKRNGARSRWRSRSRSRSPHRSGRWPPRRSSPPRDSMHQEWPPFQRHRWSDADRYEPQHGGRRRYEGGSDAQHRRSQHTPRLRSDMREEWEGRKSTQKTARRGGSPDLWSHDLFEEANKPLAPDEQQQHDLLRLL